MGPESHAEWRAKRRLARHHAHLLQILVEAADLAPARERIARRLLLAALRRFSHHSWQRVAIGC